MHRLQSFGLFNNLVYHTHLPQFSHLGLEREIKRERERERDIVSDREIDRERERERDIVSDREIDR
jgi:hypothetical protein